MKMYKRMSLKDQFFYGLYLVSALSLIVIVFAAVLSVKYPEAAENFINSMNYLPGWASKIGISLTMFSSIFLGFSYFAENDIKYNHKKILNEKILTENLIEINLINYDFEDVSKLNDSLRKLNEMLLDLKKEIESIPKLNSKATISGIIMLNIGLFLQFFS